MIRTMPMLALLGAALGLAACSPTIKVEAPDKPIVINLNIKIEQEVRIRVDKDVDAAISAKPGIF
ncbi:MAG: YnbE family lipoprotein [Rhodospirillaceae bacterium]|nr:YnbE family lipoprotein [Rhodospirillaceae bacterium]